MGLQLGIIDYNRFWESEMIKGKLADRLDYSVLEITVAMNGTHQDSWGAWMALVTARVPELANQADLLASFKRLRASKIVKLTKPDENRREAYDYGGNEFDDEAFFFVGPFNVAITATGRQHWDFLQVLDVKQAVSIAVEYFDTLMSKSVSNVLLEEVWLSDDERFWNVTLSAEVPVPKDEGVGSTLARALTTSPNSHRVYKSFRIDAKTGRVKSMTIRDVA